MKSEGVNNSSTNGKIFLGGRGLKGLAQFSNMQFMYFLPCLTCRIVKVAELILSVTFVKHASSVLYPLGQDGSYLLPQVLCLGNPGMCGG